MRKAFIIALVVLASSLARSVGIDACGDKFLQVGRGAKFRAYAAIYPASILIYTHGAPGASTAIRDRGLQATLKAAGHTLTMVEDEQFLEQALKSDKFDPDLADRAASDVQADQGRSRGARETVQLPSQGIRSIGPIPDGHRRCDEGQGKGRTRKAKEAGIERGSFRNSDEATMSRRAALSCTLAGAVCGFGTVQAFAQATVPARGEGSVSVVYQNVDFRGHINFLGQRIPNGAAHSQTVLFEVEYGLTDNLAISVGLPYVTAKYTGQGPACPLCAASPLGFHAGPNDDGLYHGALQDFRIDLRQNIFRRPLILTPSIGV